MNNLSIPIAAAIAQQKQVESLANNIANVQTVGFKKDQLIFKEHLSNFIDDNHTNHSQGQLNPSKNLFDLALHGPGFFKILTKNGVRYSRRGTFTLSDQGELIDHRGNFLLSERNGIENKILINKESPLITRDAKILLKDQKPVKILIVEFKDLSLLKKEGGSYFINLSPKNISTKNLRTKIHQGFTENSNVNAISEMSSLIKANRHFDSVLKVIKVYDHIMGKGVNEISKF